VKQRLSVFENRLLRRIFGPRRGEVTGRWRKQHNKGLHKSYSLPRVIRMVKSRRMRKKMDRACSTKGSEKDCILVTGWNAGRKETTRKTKM
jgi:hypothetical protein